MTELDWRAISRRPDNGKAKKGRNKIVSALFIVTIPADFPPRSGSGFHFSV